MDRSKKAIRNVFTGVSNKLILMLFAFVTRTMFIRLLGAEFAGINSFFTNVISVLSLAEMGVGNVFMYYLYSAIAKKDEELISNLLGEFKRVYYCIILIILILGTCLIPFLRIVNTDIPFNQFLLYYELYLIDCIASYFVAYRLILIKADQRVYIIDLIQTISTICMYIMQLLVLILYKSFGGYLAIQIAFTIICNLLLNRLAVKDYPYTKRLRRKKRLIVLKDKNLWGNIKATFLFKISDTILDQTDCIIISILLGTLYVGYYYNYLLLITYLSALGGIIANGMLASYGDLVATSNKEHLYKMFIVSMRIFAFYGTVCTACYTNIVQDFVPIWIGENYLLDNRVIIAILLVFYLRMVTNTIWIYRSALGLFKSVQYINVFAAVINVVLSIIGGVIWGIPGIIIATAISRLLTSFWYEGMVVFKSLMKPVSDYFLYQLKDFLICIIVTLLSYIICGHITIGGIYGILIKLVITVILVSVFEYAVYRGTEEHRYIIWRLSNFFPSLESTSRKN